MLKKLATYHKQNGLAKALREIGRIERTLFMLDWFRHPALPRRVRYSCTDWEKSGTENQSYRASGLTLLTVSIAQCNTVYMERAVDTLQRKGLKIKE